MTLVEVDLTLADGADPLRTYRRFMKLATLGTRCSASSVLRGGTLSITQRAEECLIDAEQGDDLLRLYFSEDIRNERCAVIGARLARAERPHAVFASDDLDAEVARGRIEQDLERAIASGGPESPAKIDVWS